MWGDEAADNILAPMSQFSILQIAKSLVLAISKDMKILPRVQLTAFMTSGSSSPAQLFKFLCVTSHTRRSEPLGNPASLLSAFVRKSGTVWREGVYGR